MVASIPSASPNDINLSGATLTQEREVSVAVREIQHEVRIDLTNAPKLTNVIGRSRKPFGLRLTYGLRRDVARVDITVEYENDAEFWPPSAEMPGWLSRIVQDHRPCDVDDPQDARPTGMGGWALNGAATGGRS